MSFTFLRTAPSSFASSLDALLFGFPFCFEQILAFLFLQFPYRRFDHMLANFSQARQFVPYGPEKQDDKNAAT